MENKEKFMEILTNLKPDVNFLEEKNLIEDGLLDSFDIMTLVANVQSEFDIEFPMAKILPENFASADLIYNIIESELED